MCVIATNDRGEIPTWLECQDMEQSNPHGIGIAWRDKEGRIQFRRNISLDKVWKCLQQIRTEKTAYVLHFRIATQGGIKPFLCHPFPVTDRVADMMALKGSCGAVLAHNGTWSGWRRHPVARNNPRLMADGSDSMAMAYLHAMGHWFDKIGWNKVVVLNDKELKLFGNWSIAGGISYSNLGWCSSGYRKRSRSTTTTGYSGSRRKQVDHRVWSHAENQYVEDKDIGYLLLEGGKAKWIYFAQYDPDPTEGQRIDYKIRESLGMIKPVVASSALPDRSTPGVTIWEANRRRFGQAVIASPKLFPNGLKLPQWKQTDIGPRLIGHYCYDIYCACKPENANRTDEQIIAMATTFDVSKVPTGSLVACPTCQHSMTPARLADGCPVCETFNEHEGIDGAKHNGLERDCRRCVDLRNSSQRKLVCAYCAKGLKEDGISIMRPCSIFGGRTVGWICNFCHDKKEKGEKLEEVLDVCALPERPTCCYFCKAKSEDTLLADFNLDGLIVKTCKPCYTAVTAEMGTNGSRRRLRPRSTTSTGARIGTAIGAAASAARTFLDATGRDGKSQPTVVEVVRVDNRTGEPVAQREPLPGVIRQETQLARDINNGDLVYSAKDGGWRRPGHRAVMPNDMVERELDRLNVRLDTGKP